jgi:hypothetical protein
MQAEDIDGEEILPLAREHVRDGHVGESLDDRKLRMYPRADHVRGRRAIHRHRNRSGPVGLDDAASACEANILHNKSFIPQ